MSAPITASWDVWPAEGMVKGLKAEGKTKAQIVAVTGVAQQLNVQTRVAAFKDVLAKNPGFDLVAAEDGKWNTALTEKVTGELLVRFNARGGVDGVFAMADNQATGAIQADRVPPASSSAWPTRASWSSAATA